MPFSAFEGVRPFCKALPERCADAALGPMPLTARVDTRDFRRLRIAYFADAVPNDEPDKSLQIIPEARFEIREWSRRSGAGGTA